MAFRPCIDLKEGRVVQIVGGTLSDDGQAVVNHVSERSAADFAALYRQDGLRGGHVVMLGPGSQEAARSALRAYPGGLQVGGGIGLGNAAAYLDAGASHVIVTSFLFEDGDLSLTRLAAMVEAVGRERLVVDLSCRKGRDGAYFVAVNRWQTVLPVRLSRALLQRLEPYCDEFLIHAADVEGKQGGIDEYLVHSLGEWSSIPTTYAGGARDLADISRVEDLSGGRLDLTIGSALDIFGGSLVAYRQAAKLGRRSDISIRGG
jgi:phosphoribosylformimino-5-aminoimidazole carboxamide ribotide isomerase